MFSELVPENSEGWNRVVLVMICARETRGGYIQDNLYFPRFRSFGARAFLSKGGDEE